MSNPSMRYKRDLDMSKFRSANSEGSVVKELANAAGIFILTVLVVGYLLHRIDLVGRWIALPF